MKIFQFSAFQHFLRLCFSFSCSGFDFKLIKEPHIKLLFVFIKVPIKNKKLTNSLLVTVVAKCYKETTNTEKLIYFLSLMSCSINELKSQMFPHVKTMGFKILRGKIFFAPVNGGGFSAVLIIELKFQFKYLCSRFFLKIVFLFLALQ